MNFCDKHDEYFLDECGACSLEMKIRLCAATTSWINDRTDKILAILKMYPERRNQFEREIRDLQAKLLFEKQVLEKLM